MSPSFDSSVFESHGEVAVQVLHVLTMFSRLQENLDWLPNNWIKSFPDTAPTWDISELRVIRDAERVERFRAAAQANRSSSDLSEFVPVFNRVKSTRDLLAHTGRLEFAFADERPVIRIGHFYGDRRIKSLPSGRADLDGHLLRTRARETLWLLSQVQWVSDEAGYYGGPNRINSSENAPSRLP